MVELSWLDLVIASCITYCASLVAATFGLGFGIISVPILFLVNPLLAPVPQLVMAVPLSIALARRERASVDRSGVAWILAGKVPGALIGVGVLSVVTKRALDMVIGTSVLVAVIALASGLRLSRSRGLDFGAGVASGTMGVIASIGGPPIALLLSDQKGPALRSTLGAIAAIGSSLSLLARHLAGQLSVVEIWIGLGLLVPAVLGFLTSKRLLTRAEGRPIRNGVLALSFLASFSLLVRGVLGL